MSRELPRAYSVSAKVHEKMKNHEVTGKKRFNCQTARESSSVRL